jgi:hypothetical protein
MQHESRALVSQLREVLTKQRYNPVVVDNYCDMPITSLST